MIRFLVTFGLIYGYVALLRGVWLARRIVSRVLRLRWDESQTTMPAGKDSPTHLRVIIDTKPGRLLASAVFIGAVLWPLRLMVVEGLELEHHDD